jgi:hypothetical protein
VIRLALRQFRTEAIIAFAMLVALAVVLAVTGAHLVSVSDAFKSTCKAAHDCATRNPLLNVDESLRHALEFIGIIAPALVGLFFGAPLIAREIETGTFRLSWTQSVTRKRWLAVKLGLIGLAAMAFGGLLTWMVDWWMSPIDAVNQDRFGVASFGFHGVAPIGYAAFAVAYWVRPNFASPAHESVPLSAGSGPSFGKGPGGGVFAITPPQVTIPNGWVYSTNVVDKSGHSPTSQYVFDTCRAFFQQPPQAPPSGGKGAPTSQGVDLYVSCVRRLSSTLHTVVTYQPGSRLWPFQWAEMGVFLAAALALCGLTYWWLRRQYA